MEDEDEELSSERPTLVDDIEISLVPVGASPATRNRALLTVLTGPQVGEVYKVPSDTATIGRSAEADVTIPDPSLSRVHAKLLSEAGQFFLRDAGSTNGTFIEGHPVDLPIRIDPGTHFRLGRRTVVSLSLHDELEENAALSMREAALRDRLTGAYNRGVFDDRLAAEVAFCIRHRTSLSLLLFDIDHFKRFNDQYGHVAGDGVLAAVGATVNGTVRTEDVLARYGGEEFAVIARGTPSDQSRILGERIRTAIASCQLPQLPPITASVGIATMDAQGDFGDERQLLAAADSALYEAKRRGRNVVVHHDTGRPAAD